MGGVATTLCSAPGPGRSGTWDSSGMIVFSASGGTLYRVSTGGGTPEILASLDLDKGEVEYRDPKILPGGKAVLFTVFRGGYKLPNRCAFPGDGEARDPDRRRP